MTSIVAGVDRRFRFAAPVYGCGYLGEDSAWLKQFGELGLARAERWLSLWDPSRHVGGAKMPMLWVNGTNDFAYPMGSWKKTYRLAKGERALALRVRMPHGHPQGAKVDEIFAFADWKLKGGARPVRVTGQGMRGELAWVKFAGAGVKAELAFTRDTGKWQERKWETVAATVRGGRAEAAVPAGAKVFYLNVFDGEGRVVSGEFVER